MMGHSIIYVLARYAEDTDLILLPGEQGEKHQQDQVSACFLCIRPTKSLHRIGYIFRKHYSKYIVEYMGLHYILKPTEISGTCYSVDQ